MKLNDFQKKVLRASGNVLVNASAGSGKTSTMIAKIIKLVTEGVNIRNILVITFTVAAAAEMKQKLVKKIYDSARENDANYKVLLKQLDNIPFANICTIDSFCLNIFQRYFALVNRDPSCGMLDPDQTPSVLNGIIDGVCQDYIDAHDERFLELAKHFSQSRRLDILKNTITTLYYFLVKQEDVEKYKNEVLLNAATDDKIMAYFRAHLDKTVAALAESTASYMRILPLDNKEEIDKAKYIYTELNELQQKDTLTALRDLLILCENPQPNIKGSPIKDHIKEYYSQLKETREQFDSYYYMLNTGRKSGKHKEKLVEVVLKAQERYHQYKLKRNLVDFDDLKHYTLKILQNDKARAEICGGLDYIFVDEYQDTDYLQEAMLKAISRNDNVFVVGDMKQSIYRFRYAEPKIFHTRMQEYDSQKTGTNIPLSINYRSDGRILHFVNEVCKEIMTEDFCNIDYKNSSMLDEGRKLKIVSDEPACAIYTYNQSRKHSKRQGYFSVKEAVIEDKIDAEGLFVVDKIKHLVDNVMIDAGEGCIRKLQYKDIALLSSRRSGFSKIIKELDKAEIPYNLDDAASGKDENLEVLVNFVRIIHNMSQDIPLANVLTSAMFDFEIPELLHIRKENPQPTFSQSFCTYNKEGALKVKVEKFLRLMEKYRVQANYAKVTELMLDVMSLGYDAYLLSQGEQVIEKINSFIQFVAERKENDSVEEFLYFYDNTYSGHKTNVETDALTVTTIHKSKGLEYPVVFVVGADASINIRKDTSKFYTDKEFGIAVKGFDDDEYREEDNFATAVFKLKSKTEERQELARLLYVALTRAQNHLIITGSVPKDIKKKSLSKINSFMDFLLYVQQRNGSFARYFNQIDVENFSEAELGAPLEEVSKSVNLSSLDDKYKYLASTVSSAKYSVSSLVNMDNQQDSVQKLYDYVEKESGINYHTVLQFIDYNAVTKEQIRQEISRLIEDNLLEKNVAEKMDIALLERVMNSQILALARQRDTLREQPFMLYTDCVDGLNKLQDKVLVQGVIDLLILDKEVILVDFKTSFGSPNYLKKQYSRQLELYAKAVEDIMGYKVGRKVIYNILKDFVVEIP